MPSYQNIKERLLELLNEFAESEKTKHLATFNNVALRNAERTEKMKPLLILLKSIQDEIGEMEGINLFLSESSASIIISEYPERIEYNISHCHPGFSKFVFKTIRTFAAVGEMGEGSRDEEKRLFDLPEEVLSIVLKQIGKFIGNVQDRSERVQE